MYDKPIQKQGLRQVLDMQVNKHGIPVTSKRKSIKKQVQQEIHNILDFREFVEFVRYEQGVEVTAVVPNFRPVVQAMKEQSWIFVKFTSKEDIM